MLIYSMSVSVDGFIADLEGAFGWAAPNEELFRYHLAQVPPSVLVHSLRTRHGVVAPAPTS